MANLPALTSKGLFYLSLLQHSLKIQKHFHSKLHLNLWLKIYHHEQISLQTKAPFSAEALPKWHWEWKETCRFVCIRDINSPAHWHVCKAVIWEINPPKRTKFHFHTQSVIHGLSLLHVKVYNEMTKNGKAKSTFCFLVKGRKCFCSVLRVWNGFWEIADVSIQVKTVWNICSCTSIFNCLTKLSLCDPFSTTLHGSQKFAQLPRKWWSLFFRLSDCLTKFDFFNPTQMS